MPWYLPEKRRQLVRLYTNALCSGEWTLARRRYLLFLILRPAIEWIKEKLVEEGLESDEAESEMFLLVSKLFLGYDSEKRCFLYHIERKLPWLVSTLLKKLTKQEKEEPSGLILDEKTYEMDGEVYLTIPNILFEDRWMARDLSQHEKNLILRMLIEDQPGRRALANNRQVSESTIDRDLRILAGKLKGRLSKW